MGMWYSLTVRKDAHLKSEFIFHIISLLKSEDFSHRQKQTLCDEV